MECWDPSDQRLHPQLSGCPPRWVLSLQLHPCRKTGSSTPSLALVPSVSWWNGFKMRPHFILHFWFLQLSSIWVFTFTNCTNFSNIIFCLMGNKFVFVHCLFISWVKVLLLIYKSFLYGLRIIPLPVLTLLISDNCQCCLHFYIIKSINFLHYWVLGILK
jgi:hypothetical protein